MANEKDLLNEIQLAASRSRRCILFRNNVGSAWVGRVIQKTSSTITLQDFRPLRAGLTPGSSDLIGWTMVEITPGMVGRTIAVFTAIEAKTKNVRLSDKQINFLKRVKESGGIADEIREIQNIGDVISAFENSNP
jgi:VRR-NUC domain